MRDSSVGMLAASRKSGRASGVDAALRAARLWGRLKTGCAAEVVGTAQECARHITAQEAASQTEGHSAQLNVRRTIQAVLSTMGLMLHGGLSDQLGFEHVRLGHAQSNNSLSKG